MMGSWMRVRRRAAMGLGIASLAALACSERPSEPRAAAPAPPACSEPASIAAPASATARATSAVLIVVDTLRADRIVVDGPERPTSPRLRAWACRGTAFRRSYSHASSTRPSVATILTSRLPSGHGVASHGTDALAAEVPFLPEILHGAGLRTLAVVTNPQLHPVFGFARGFDVFRPLFVAAKDPLRPTAPEVASPPAGEVLGAARAELEGLPADAPFFAYLHLLDPHGPYEPPAAWRERFVDPDYEGSVSGSFFDFVLKNEIRASARGRAQLAALYDAEVAYTDDAIGAFLDWMEKSGRLARTLVVVTADHGEELFEHGDLGHGLTLFDEAVRVPLLVLGPGIAAGVVRDDLVGGIDVAPTIVAELGVAVPEGAWSGRPLPVTPAAEAGVERALVLEGPWLGQVERSGVAVARVSRAVVQGDTKIVSRENVRGEPAWRELEVFDLARDPGELDGRRIETATAPADVDVVSRYEAAVAQALAVRGPDHVPVATLPADDARQLEALGYLPP